MESLSFLYIYGCEGKKDLNSRHDQSLFTLHNDTLNCAASSSHFEICTVFTALNRKLF